MHSKLTTHNSSPYRWEEGIGYMLYFVWRLTANYGDDVEADRQVNTVFAYIRIG